MDHPLKSIERKDLRQRVASLIGSSYNVARNSNIIFVCGGNDDSHMRTRFREYCEENVPDLEIFLPEYAIEDALQTEEESPFDLTDFEELISELSMAVVIFPEAPGSFAETGYFSAIDKIAGRCILALNSKYQNIDSFLSLGPAKKIGSKTRFSPIIQLDYEDPDFSAVIARIGRITKKYKKALTFEAYIDLNSFELSCVIHEIVRLLVIATIEDLLFILTLIFKNRYSKPKIRKLTSILLGSKYLLFVGEFGHMRINPRKGNLLHIKEGYVSEENSIKLELASLFLESDLEFLKLIDEVSDAD